MLEQGGSDDGLPELVYIELLEVCGVAQDERAGAVDGAGGMVPPDER